MKSYKALPALTIGLCVPGVAVRALHLLNGFEIGTGLPAAGSVWLTACIALFALAAVVFAVCALPLRAEKHTPFETLLGTQNVSFRTAAVTAGLLVALGGVAYLLTTLRVPEQDAAVWARALEYVYAALTVIAGASLLGLAGAQGRTMTARSAALTLPPLIWSCAHLLVTYRMTCIDPKLPSFGFGLVADVLLVLAFYHLARLLYGKPNPSLLAFFSASATVIAVSDLGGYGVAWLMGLRAVDWPAKTLLRGGVTVAACVLLLAELFLLAREPIAEPEMQNVPQSGIE